MTNVFATSHRDNGSAGEAGHEQVVFCQDTPTGLRAIIGIYSTALGPALGGTRFYPYASEGEALADVLRLSKAMAYKNAVAAWTTAAGKPSSSATPPGSRPRPCCAPTAASSSPSADATSPRVTWAPAARTWTSSPGNAAT